MHTMTVAALSAALQKGTFSSVELTQHYLDRIKAMNPRLNPYITIAEERALADAEAADARLAQGNAGPLTGIPLAHKDLFCTEGLRTSCASKMLDNFISPYNATVVQNLADAGMVVLGKTNMDEFAMGSSNENSFYGPVCNPWQEDCVPGGSSGGSAVAVAARLAPAATGTDTGGSIRQPAAFTGITGLKPTYGRISRYGMVAFASSLDQAGPMTQTAEDAAMLLQAMAGFDPKDSTSVDLPVPNYTEDLDKPLTGITIGLVKEYFDGLAAPMVAALEETRKVLEKLGAKFKEVSLPNSGLSVATYYIVAPAECSSNLARFDGVRYGYRCENPKDLTDLYTRSRGEGFGDEVKRRIMVGTYVLSSGYYDAYYLKAQQARQLIHQDFQNVFKEVDCLLGPTTPTPAFKIGEKSADPVAMYLSDIYTIATNMAGLPGLSMPMGFIDNLPVGAQLTTNHFQEARLLNIAHQYQQETDWHQKLPTICE